MVTNPDLLGYLYSAGSHVASHVNGEKNVCCWLKVEKGDGLGHVRPSWVKLGEKCKANKPKYQEDRALDQHAHLMTQN